MLEYTSTSSSTPHGLVHPRSSATAADRPDEAAAAHSPSPHARAVDHPPSRSPPAKGVLVCFCAGVLMSLWSPLSAMSMSTDADGGCDGCFTPYGSAALFTSGLLLTTPPICKLLCMHPLVGPRTTLGQYFALSRAEHAWGLLGGTVWAVGTISNLISGGAIGLALSYAIGQAAPMVAAGWGLVYYREFRGLDATTGLLIAGMYVWYSAGIVLTGSSRLEAN